MAGAIHIEARDVEVLGVPSGAAHLYLVLRDSDGREFVLSAGPEDERWPFGTPMAVEANLPLERSRDDRGGDSPEDRLSTPLQFPALDTDAAWALMTRYAERIADAGIDYVLLEENSNAFVGALIAAAGGAPAKLLPDGLDRDRAVGLGSWDEIRDAVPPPADGTLRGGAGDDVLAGLQVGERIEAKQGDDVVRAGRGDDVVLGGSGDDRLFGEQGFDTLRGGRGDDLLRAGGPGESAGPGAETRSDSLFGNAGADRLIGSKAGDLLDGGSGDDRIEGRRGADLIAGGRGDDLIDGGAGRNRLEGGEGADVFHFRAALRCDDRILDYEAGIDAIRIEATPGDGALEVAQSGNGRHAILSVGEARIVVRDAVIDADEAAGFLVAPEADLIV